MHARGRPVVGAIAGFFFGLFLGVTLLILGVYALNSIWLVVFPLALLVLGIAWAYWAPLGPRTPPPRPTTPEAAPAS